MAVNKTHGGHQVRVGLKFHEAMEDIRIERISKKISKEKASAEKITNMIVRHKLWKEIANNIINASEEELDNYGK